MSPVCQPDTSDQATVHMSVPTGKQVSQTRWWAHLFHCHRAWVEFSKVRMP